MATHDHLAGASEARTEHPNATRSYSIFNLNRAMQYI